MDGNFSLFTFVGVERLAGRGDFFENYFFVYINFSYLVIWWKSFVNRVSKLCSIFLGVVLLFYSFVTFQVMFPSTLLGTGENWTMMRTISVTEYLNYESGYLSSGSNNQMYTFLGL